MPDDVRELLEARNLADWMATRVEARRNTLQYTRKAREIRWTQESEDHIAEHDVSPDEVEQVIYTRPRWIKKGREGTEEVYGTTNAGRYLLVILSESQDGPNYVVTARNMTDSERRTFRRKAR